MKTHWRRLLLALFLSAVSLAATVAYYHATAPAESARRDAPTVAVVRTLEGTHHSRREQSRFWTPLAEGDLIYSGDRVRTADHGELRVQLLGSSRMLEIEADTQLTLTQKDADVTLDLIDGFVNAQAAFPGKVLQVQTAQSALPVPSEKTLIYREGGDQVRMARQSTVSVENPFAVQWKSPPGDFESELNPEDPRPVAFEWSGGQAKTRIAVEWGQSRKHLDHRKIIETAKGRLDAVLPIGRHYWRWTVLSENISEPVWTSPTALALIKGTFPPAVVSPVAGSVLKLTDAGEKIALRWLPNKKFSEYLVEVAASPAFTDKILEARKGAKETQVELLLPRLGGYHWRLSGFESASGRWLRGKAHVFRAQLKGAERVNVKWVTAAEQTFHYSTPRPSARLEWSAEPPRSAAQYRVRVAGAGEELTDAPAELTDATALTVALPRSGSYQARIEALNAESELVGQSQPLRFEVRPVPTLRAPAMASIGGESVLHASAKGELDMKWTAVDGAREYLIELREPTGKKKSFTSREPLYQLTRLMPGEYEVRIFAVDSGGRQGEPSETRKVLVPAKSAIKSIRIKKLEVK